MEKVSIIVPVYNVEEYLEECLKSIIEQTYRNLEIILVDDGSTDSSGKICEDYKNKDSRIKVIHQKNQGLSAARNTALKIVTGDMIQFVDSDDFIAKNMIEDLISIMHDKEADIVISSHYIYENEKVIKPEYSNQMEIYDMNQAIAQMVLDKKIRFYAWDKLYKSKLWQDVEFPVGRIFEDIATIPKSFVNAKKVVFYDHPFYYYRKREGSITMKRSKEQKLQYLSSVLDINKYLRQRTEGIEDYLDYNLVYTMINLFHAVGKYDIEGLDNEKDVQNLYNKIKMLLNDQHKLQFINEHCSNSKRTHLYYLLENPKEYIKNVKYLPNVYQ